MSFLKAFAILGRKYNTISWLFLVSNLTSLLNTKKKEKNVQVYIENCNDLSLI